MAEKGFPLTPWTLEHTSKGVSRLLEHGGDGPRLFLTPDGNVPGVGEIHRNPDMASTFRRLASVGAAEGEAQEGCAEHPL